MSKSNKQKQQAILAESRTHQLAASVQNAAWLRLHKAWNWKWPLTEDGYRNCWPGNSKPKQMLNQCYHGPSDRTLAKRAAKGKSPRKYRLSGTW